MCTPWLVLPIKPLSKSVSVVCSSSSCAILEAGASGGPEAEGILDRVVGALGRAGFLPQYAVFPVLYLDDDMAVFRFPPLNSNIAVRKVL